MTEEEIIVKAGELRAHRDEVLAQIERLQQEAAKLSGAIAVLELELPAAKKQKAILLAPSTEGVEVEAASLKLSP